MGIRLLLVLESGTSHVLLRPVIGADEEQHRLTGEVVPPRLGREVAPVPPELRREIAGIQSAAVVLKQERQLPTVELDHPRPIGADPGGPIVVPEAPRRLCLVPAHSKAAACTLSVPREPRHDAVHPEHVLAVMDDPDRRTGRRARARPWVWGADARETGIPSRRYRGSSRQEPQSHR